MDTALKIIGWVMSPLLATVIGILFGKLSTYKKNASEKDKESKIEYDAIRESCKFMLRKLLEDDYKFYVEEQEWCSIEDKAEVENVYHTYHEGLHGNGQGTRYFNAIMELPEHKIETK